MKRKPRPSEVRDMLNASLSRAGCDPARVAHCERPNITATEGLVSYLIEEEEITLGRAVRSCLDSVMIQRLISAEDDEFGCTGHMPPMPNNQREQQTIEVRDSKGEYQKHFEVPSELAWLFRCSVSKAAEEMGVQFWSVGWWLQPGAKKWEAIFTLTLPSQSRKPPSSCTHTLRRYFDANKYHPADSIKRGMREVAAEELARLSTVLSPLALRET